MELKDLQQHWNGFPDISMEERPVLSSDLEQIVVRNPLSDAFYLKNRLLARIIIFSTFLLLDTWLLRVQWKTEGNDLYLLMAFLLLLTYSLYFHIRLLFFADYPTLLSLPLMSFLAKLETVLDKYIISFKMSSAISAFSLLILFEQLLAIINPQAYDSFSRNDWYKWLLLIFLAISFDIILLQVAIPKYRKLLETVRKYRTGILAKAQYK